MAKVGGNRNNDEGDNLPAAKKLPSSMIVEPRCKVCMSGMRSDIEIWLARGYSFNAIEREIRGAGLEISAKSVARHRDSHMNMRDESFRQIMERQATELMEAEGQGVVRIVSGKAWLDIFIQQATDRLIAGEMEIEAKDVVKAIELRDALEREGIDIFQQEIMLQLRAIIEAMKQVIGAEVARQISIKARVIVEEMRNNDGRALPEEVEAAEFEVLND